MESYTLALSSATMALKAQNVLSKYSIRSTVVRVDPGMTRRGCSFGIRFDAYNADNARLLLTRNSIKYSELNG